MPIPLSGNIQTTPLPDILEELRKSKASGTLTIRNGNTVKSIFVKAGEIVFASSTDTNDRLGEILVKCRKLSKENLEHALQLSRKVAGLKKMGAILVENGFLTPKDLFNGLKIQVKDIIFSIFLWPQGEYRFEKHLPGDVIMLQLNIHVLITEIIQRIKQES
jgi:hypothetical protein